MRRAVVQQAGAIIFQVADGPQVLLVRAKRTPQWICPKGHIEEDESAEDAALREAREEAGVDGRIVARLRPQLKFQWLGAAYRVRYFLVECLTSGHPHEPRAQLWVSPKEALELVTYEGLRQVLRAAVAALEERNFEL